jgi:hypothetical protein
LALKTNDIVQYFVDLEKQDKLPAFEDLEAMAKKLNRAYSTTKGYYQAMGGLEAETSWWLSMVPKGSDWNLEEDQMDSDAEIGDKEQTGKLKKKKKQAQQAKKPKKPKKNSNGEDDSIPFKGDNVLASSISFMQMALLSREAAEAVTEGDVGCFYEVYKVSTIFNGPNKRQTHIVISSSGCFILQGPAIQSTPPIYSRVLHVLSLSAVMNSIRLSWVSCSLA